MFVLRSMKWGWGSVLVSRLRQALGLGWVMHDCAWQRVISLACFRVVAHHLEVETRKWERQEGAETGVGCPCRGQNVCAGGVRVGWETSCTWWRSARRMLQCGSAMPACLRVWGVGTGGAQGGVLI